MEKALDANGVINGLLNLFDEINERTHISRTDGKAINIDMYTGTWVNRRRGECVVLTSYDCAMYAVHGKEWKHVNAAGFATTYLPGSYVINDVGLPGECIELSNDDLVVLAHKIWAAITEVLDDCVKEDHQFLVDTSDTVGLCLKGVYVDYSRPVRKHVIPPDCDAWGYYGYNKLSGYKRPVGFTVHQSYLFQLENTVYGNLGHYSRFERELSRILYEMKFRGAVSGTK